MTRRRPITFLAGAALLPLVALAVAACGSGGNATAASKARTSASSPAPAPAAAHTTPAIRVSKTRLGHVLVDSRGRTLYLFTKDSGTKSECSGACASAWPPLQASGKPTVSGAARASLVGTTKRSDGSAEVTYDGHPLYTFIKDTKAGDTNGERLTAFGGTWFAISQTGKRITGRSSKSRHRSSSASAARPTQKTAPHPTAPPATRPAPAPPPTRPPAASSGIPQNNGGDQDSDNNGGPDDGDGGV